MRGAFRTNQAVAAGTTVEDEGGKLRNYRYARHRLKLGILGV